MDKGKKTFCKASKYNVLQWNSGVRVRGARFLFQTLYLFILCPRTLNAIKTAKKNYIMELTESRSHLQELD